MRSLARAFALFSAVPVPWRGEPTRHDAAVALRWLPFVGALLGGVAGLPLVAVREWAPDSELLGAVISVCLLVLLTRALHFDGLADTADGLGSHAHALRALEIMRRSDVGPFGVLAIVLVVLLDVAALASLPGGVWAPVGALALAAATGRVAVLVAASRRVPAARSEGFGAMVARSVTPPLALGQVLLLLDASAVAARAAPWVVAPAAALVLCVAFVGRAVRRLGGVTGDVFGALVELGTALTLVGLAFS